MVFSRKDGDFHGRLLLVSGRVVDLNQFQPGLGETRENDRRSTGIIRCDLALDFPAPWDWWVMMMVVGDQLPCY